MSPTLGSRDHLFGVTRKARQKEKTHLVATKPQSPANFTLQALLLGLASWRPDTMSAAMGFVQMQEHSLYCRQKYHLQRVAVRAGHWVVSMLVHIQTKQLNPKYQAHLAI